jgi:hypothetical protein
MQTRFKGVDWIILAPDSADMAIILLVRFKARSNAFQCHILSELFNIDSVDTIPV